MDISPLLKQVGKVAAKNSPAILTALGVTGTITTAILAAKGAFKSAGDIVAEEAERALKVEAEELTPEDAAMTRQDKFNLTWKNYVPAAIVGAATIGAIICSHNIADRRAAAAAAAYTFVEKSFKDYQDKTKTKIGEKKERELRDELAQERFDRRPVRPVIITGKGNTLFYDAWSGRTFYSDMQAFQKAVNQFNSDIIGSGYGSLSEFWSLLGLDPTQQSDNIGWPSERILEYTITSVITADDEPAISYEFSTRPTLRFDCLH
ncbi:hypothetical protein SEA_LIBERTYBELL_42 [Streptomyces phage LibertyBell]|nr:hypothetical protein SEA_LIBERTYBELL_42 [Streptomyces phage LibertyBell]